MTLPAALHPNRASADNCLDYYQKELTPFVLGQLRQLRGGEPEDHIRNALSDRPGQQLQHFNENLKQANGHIEKALDLPNLHTIILKLWNEAFRKAFNGYGINRERIQSLSNLRNEVEHAKLDDLAPDPLLQSIAEILQILPALNPTQESREQIRRERYAVMERALNEYRAAQGLPPLTAPDPDAPTPETLLNAELTALRTAHAAELAAERAAFQQEADQAATARAWTQELLALEAAAAGRSAAAQEMETAAAAQEAAVAKHEAAATALTNLAANRSRSSSNPNPETFATALAKTAATRTALQALLPVSTDQPGAVAPDPLPQAIRAFEQSLSAAIDPALAELQAEIKQRQAAATETLAAARARQAAAQRRHKGIQDRQAPAEALIAAAQDLWAAQSETGGAAPRPGKSQAGTAVPANNQSKDQSLLAAEDDLFNEGPRRPQADPPLPADLPARWKQVLTQLNKQKGAQYNLGALLRDCRPDRITREPSGALCLPFKNALNAERMTAELSAAPVREQVEAAVAAALGFHSALRIQAPPPATPSRDNAV